MQEFFLDTSIQALRIFYLKEDRQKFEVIFLNLQSYNLSISRYSWFEFYHTWVIDLYKIMRTAYESKDLSEFFANLGISQDNKSRILLALSSVIKGNNPTTKEISLRAFKILKYELKFAFYNHNGKQITEIDHLSCNILTNIEQQFTVYEESGVPKIRFPSFDTCSRERAECKIVDYITPLIPELKSAINAMENNIPKRDEKFRKKGKDIIENPKKARGSTCGSISDWLMITESPKGSTVVTTDEDWNIIAKSLNRKCIKIEIKPKYDKHGIKKAMMDEQLKQY